MPYAAALIKAPHATLLGYLLRSRSPPLRSRTAPRSLPLEPHVIGHVPPRRGTGAAQFGNLGAVPRGPPSQYANGPELARPPAPWRVPGAAFDLVGWVLDLADVWHGPVSRAGT